MASCDSAALLAAAVRAAVLAKAPRRTVQAVAAAVTGVLVHSSTESAAPVRKIGEKRSGQKHSTATGEAGDLQASPEVLLEALRTARREQRRRKKERRRAARAKSSTDAEEDIEGLQTPSCRTRHSSEDECMPEVEDMQAEQPALEQGNEGDSTPTHAVRRALEKDECTAASPPTKALCILGGEPLNDDGSQGGVTASASGLRTTYALAAAAASVSREIPAVTQSPKKKNPSQGGKPASKGEYVVTARMIDGERVEVVNSPIRFKGSPARKAKGQGKGHK
eukprot:gnl/MRDRNA2_/MRDRNA2_87511_c0_seq1.p1 gnl/MRDRNA2_/MRDRNA2_87511_c0~~gnl/MRDRNA2_/MRDRNA2_87511_c0_seq1.p1  ORF type:complete len:280 (-),score=73.30 gnl/MRDRNA2_/MRDRNA2_87511_c0_seq1:381-1220(-)